MNKAKLKTYAPQARRDFIAAVTARAHLLGIAEKNGTLDIAPGEKTGDILLIAGQAWPAKVHQQRERLIKRIHKEGFAHTIEAVAYTWFNRFAALRFMEIHDYLEHGYRALSSREGGLPEILTRATEVAGTLSGLSASQVTEMKLAGNKDGELYRLLLVAQCNALSAAMPFLFERIDDETELLLPDNLLRTDSVIAKLVAEIPEEDWAEVEIIGWLYQFYISEKKDQVIGKVVKSEDIPAATQLFTPNWIVQYLVQNSVGRLWLMANPTSTLKAEWPYYIEPAEQTPEVNAQLDALIQTRMAEDGGSLNPESITVLDPACGSGHILVEAYALLKGIYLERGYRLRDIPRLILEKNLYGLDIDDRAAQLAGFALLMKARADDRRLFNDPPRLKVLSLQESKGLDLDELATHLAPFGVERATVKALLDTFEHAKTFGSLIQIPDALNAQLPSLAEALAKANETGDLYAQAAAQDLLVLVEQAQVLGCKFDAVVANPPYMGSNGMDPSLKIFIREHFDDSKSDLFASFIERSYSLLRKEGYGAMITMQTWMFLSSFEKMRLRLLRERSIQSMVHIGFNSFPSMNSKIALATAFVTQAAGGTRYRGTFVNLNSAPESADKNLVFLERDSSNYHFVTGDDLLALPGGRVAYWVSDRARMAFRDGFSLSEIAKPRIGMRTGDDVRFVRRWFEVDMFRFAKPNGSPFSSLGDNPKWVPFLKGGDFRKWYGNYEHVVDWENDGYEIKKLTIQKYPGLSWENLGWKISNEEYYFAPCITWSDISLLHTFGARYCGPGFIISTIGCGIYGSENDLLRIVGLLNSSLTKIWLPIINPSLHANPGDLAQIPVCPLNEEEKKCLERDALECLRIGINDWDSFERSWDFLRSPLLSNQVLQPISLEVSYNGWLSRNEEEIEAMRRAEESSNALLIHGYGLNDEISKEVSLDQITLTVNAVHRYGGQLKEQELLTRFRRNSMEELVSYAIGCMMGRYSLDEPGLIYAHAGNVGFDATRYKTFPADADGIVPITDEFWFEDDAANRVREFLRAVWGADTLDENMAWLAESLGTKANETPDETIRRYLADKFFKDHLQTYKKRPIYWLFSSGKQGAFQALVYLHRYFDGTLARLRAEYVVPLTGKMQARIEMLEKDATAAPSTAARNKLNKQIEKLRKKHVELLAYDEKLRHYADMRISLDLDDGVKVNYGKFGDLLAEVKAVTGGAGDE